MEENREVVENFYGVYLLYCVNPKYKGRIYIGYTVDPNRRIKQHNAGMKFGGAWRTNNKGPWKMALIVHGFPNDISALRFEWAWQHPDRSRRLKHLQGKKNNKNNFDYHIMILSEMLRVGPWFRLPLTIRWLVPELSKDFPTDRSPPIHMPLVYGKVFTKKIFKISKKSNDDRGDEIKGRNKNNRDEKIDDDDDDDIFFSAIKNDDSVTICSICYNIIDDSGNEDYDDKIHCIKADCKFVSHLICLAEKFNEKDRMILPVEGECPKCGINVLWGDLIRKMKGCYKDLKENQTVTESDDSELGDFSY